MLATLEARWFLAGDAPAPVAVWFARHAAHPAPAAAREDRYLVLPGERELGVKLREGRLELKRRTHDLGLEALAPNVVGRLDAWAKWSLPLAADVEALVDPRDPGWVRVAKARTLRKFAARVEAGRAAVEPVPPSAVPPAGCALELTRLRIGGAAWWSLGFEAVGPPDLREAALRLLASTLAVEEGFPPLDARASMAYPEWLSVALGTKKVP